MKYKVIIFDMDGVIFDTIPFSMEMFLKNYPGTTIEDFKILALENYHEGRKKYLHLKKIKTEEEKEVDRKKYSEDKSNSGIFPGVKEFLFELHKNGHKLVLNTGAFDRNCTPLLEKNDIKNIFDFIATADLSKSKVEKFNIILEKYDIRKEEVVFVTDTIGDLSEAHELGIPTILVTWGVHDISHIPEGKNFDNLVATVNTVSELKDILNY